MDRPNSGNIGCACHRGSQMSRHMGKEAKRGISLGTGATELDRQSQQ